jgi:hypothetical protein
MHLKYIRYVLPMLNVDHYVLCALCVPDNHFKR